MIRFRSVSDSSIKSFVCSYLTQALRGPTIFARILRGFLRRGVPPTTTAVVVLAAVAILYGSFLTAELVTEAIFWLHGAPMRALLG